MHHPFHKTKTLPAIAILALGIVALSATLSSGSVLYSEDFEEAAIGLATNIAGWSSADFDTSSIMTSRIDFVEASFPIATSETGNVDNRVLELNTDGGTLTNAVNLAYESVVYLDQMVNFVAHDDDPQWLTNDVSKLAVFLNQHSNLVVMHGGVGTTNTFTAVTNAVIPAIEQGEWYRLTIEMDMTNATSGFGFEEYALPYFKVMVNGKEFSNDIYGYSAPANKAFSTDLVPDGGPWFPSTQAGVEAAVTAPGYTNVNAVCYQGTGMIDDIVLRSDAPSYPAGVIYSTYAFTDDLPARILTDTETDVDVTLATVDLGNTGYDNVRIRVQKTAGPGDVTFDSAATNFVDNGYAGGVFDLTPSYSDTITWTLTFSAAGVYDLTFSVVDDADAVVASITTVLAATVEDAVYHTYRFNLAGHDAQTPYIVTDGLVDPVDADFSGMTPIGLSIVIDDEKDIAYTGMVRVAAVAATDLQLWAKADGVWTNINVFGWGDGNGFEIAPQAETDVYVVATNAFENQQVTLVLVDVDEAYGAVDHKIIDQIETFSAEFDVIDGAPGSWVNEKWPLGDWPTDFSTSFYNSLGEMWLVGQTNLNVPFEIIEISFNNGDLIVKWYSAEGPDTVEARRVIKLLSTDDLDTIWPTGWVSDVIATIDIGWNNTNAGAGEGVNTFTTTAPVVDNLFYRLVVEPIAE